MTGPMATPHHWSRVQVAQGETAATIWDLAEGVPPTQLIVGCGQTAGWHVGAAAVAAEHFALYWDGLALFVHPVTADIFVDGEKILGWRQLVGKCRVEFGHAAMTVESSHLVPVAQPPPVPPPGYVPTGAGMPIRQSGAPRFEEDAPTGLFNDDEILEPSGLEVLPDHGMPHGHGMGTPDIYGHGQHPGHDPAYGAPPMGQPGMAHGSPGLDPMGGVTPQMPRHGRDAYGEFHQLGAEAQQPPPMGGGHGGPGDLAPQSTMLVDPSQMGAGSPAAAPQFGSGAAVPSFGMGTVDGGEVPASPTMVLYPNDPAALAAMGGPPAPGYASAPPAAPLASESSLQPMPSMVAQAPPPAPARFAAASPPEMVQEDLSFKDQIKNLPRRTWILLGVTILTIFGMIGWFQYQAIVQEEAIARREEVRRERLREASRVEAEELRARRAAARETLEQAERAAEGQVSTRVREVEARVDAEVREEADRNAEEAEIVAQVARQVRLELEREAVETLVRNQWAMAMKYYELLARRYPEEAYYAPMVPVIRSELIAQLAELGDRRRSTDEVTMTAAPAPHEEDR